MANYALDKENRIVTVQDAIFKKNYRCLECQLPLQKRLGRSKRPHFIHLKASPTCRSYGKGANHLALQLFLQKRHPSLKMEFPFPDIGRIADLVWEEEKLVFEIQCSPLSLEEAKERTQEYALKGYKIVWLLDDRLYNKKKAGPAELFMRKTGYFFSLKRRVIYDQFEVLEEEKRTFKGPNLPVNLSLLDTLRKTPQTLSDLGPPEEKSTATLFLRKIFFISLEFLLRIIAKK